MEKLENLKSKGIEIQEYDFPYLDVLVPCYYILTTAEASSNLSRFDGVHYGYRSASAKGLEETFKLSRSEGFGSEVKRRIMAGTFVLSHGYYDAYYSKAQKVRRLIKDYTKNILQENDLIMLPSTLGTAFEIGKITDPIAMYMQDIFTVHANLTGNPAISIPFAMHSNGLPYGLQFIGKEFEEQNLFQQVSQIA
jgi:aspartyl-tRNA(Asn)/glutamyl-tRNA(Gln) amidotransferase subunit A